MELPVQQDRKFETINYTENKLTGREFISCEFINCNFSKNDLTGIDFVECRFKDCDFSLSTLAATGFKDIKFENCKLLGLDFSVCNNFLFSVSFLNCNLDYSSFHRKKIKQTNFIECSIKHADFSDTDLSMALFKNCDLFSTTFLRTNLEKTDFRSAQNYTIDPEVNKVKKAKFSNLGLAGLLDKYNLDIDFR